MPKPKKKMQESSSNSDSENSEDSVSIMNGSDVKIRRTFENLRVEPSPSEIKHRKKLYPDVEQVVEERVVCTSCGDQLVPDIIQGNDVYAHPALQVLLCKMCASFYGDGQFSVDEDGTDKFCRWCAQGGTLYCCSKCNCAFCKKCVKRNLKRSFLSEIEEEDWQCFVCNIDPLWDHRAQCWAAMECSKLRRKRRKRDREIALKVLKATKSSPAKRKTVTSIKSSLNKKNISVSDIESSESCSEKRKPRRKTNNRKGKECDSDSIIISDSDESDEESDRKRKAVTKKRKKNRDSDSDSDSYSNFSDEMEGKGKGRNSKTASKKRKTNSNLGTRNTRQRGKTVIELDSDNSESDSDANKNVKKSKQKAKSKKGPDKDKKKKGEEEKDGTDKSSSEANSGDEDDTTWITECLRDASQIGQRLMYVAKKIKKKVRGAKKQTDVKSQLQRFKKILSYAAKDIENLDGLSDLSEKHWRNGRKKKKPKKKRGKRESSDSEEELSEEDERETKKKNKDNKESVKEQSKASRQLNNDNEEMEEDEENVDRASELKKDETADANNDVDVAADKNIAPEKLALETRRDSDVLCENNDNTNESCDLFDDPDAASSPEQARTENPDKEVELDEENSSEKENIPVIDGTPVKQIQRNYDSDVTHLESENRSAIMANESLSKDPDTAKSKKKISGDSEKGKLEKLSDGDETGTEAVSKEQDNTAPSQDSLSEYLKFLNTVEHDISKNLSDEELVTGNDDEACASDPGKSLPKEGKVHDKSSENEEETEHFFKPASLPPEDKMTKHKPDDSQEESQSLLKSVDDDEVLNGGAGSEKEKSDSEAGEYDDGPDMHASSEDAETVIFDRRKKKNDAEYPSERAPSRASTTENTVITERALTAKNAILDSDSEEEDDSSNEDEADKQPTKVMTKSAPATKLRKFIGPKSVMKARRRALKKKAGNVSGSSTSSSSDIDDDSDESTGKLNTSKKNKRSNIIYVGIKKEDLKKCCIELERVSDSALEQHGIKFIDDENSTEEKVAEESKDDDDLIKLSKEVKRLTNLKTLKRKKHCADSDENEGAESALSEESEKDEDKKMADKEEEEDKKMADKEEEEDKKMADKEEEEDKKMADKEEEEDKKMADKEIEDDQKIADKETEEDKKIDKEGKDQKKDKEKKEDEEKEKKDEKPTARKSLLDFYDCKSSDSDDSDSDIEEFKKLSNRLKSRRKVLQQKVSGRNETAKQMLLNSDSSSDSSDESDSEAEKKKKKNEKKSKVSVKKEDEDVKKDDTKEDGESISEKKKIDVDDIKDEKEDADDKDADSDEKKDKKDDKGSSSDDSEEDLKEKVKWRRSKLLMTKLSETDTSDEDRRWKARKSREAAAEKRSDDSDESGRDIIKKRKKRKNVLGSDSDDFKVSSTDESSSSSDAKEVKPNDKKRKKQSKSSSSESSSDSNKKKKTKRRRIKLLSDSESDVSSSSSDDKSKRKRSQKSGDTPGKGGRKNIKKVIKTKSLEESTKLAALEEEERRKRILDKQKLYNELYEIAEGEKAERLVLDFDPESKQALVEVHPKLVKELKPHQVKGVKFMWDACFESLSRCKKDPGSGCILAHCMGLGKTLQVVTLIHTLLTHPKTKVHTVLVVCPLNTVLNWVNELHMWQKCVDKRKEIINVFELSKYKEHYERSYQLKDWQECGGVMVVGYEMYQKLAIPNNRIKKKPKKKDLEAFKETLIDPGPDLIVCDEGHLLKNEKTIRSIALNLVRTSRRIVLTGTPLQNNLKEYHCMIQFVKPSLLGTSKEFQNRFVNPIVNGQCADSTELDVRLMKRRAHVLHKMLEGCVQRCDYSVLTPFLPPKHEYVMSIQLSPVQKKLYQYYLDHFAQTRGGRGGSCLFSDFQSLQRIWTHPRVLQMRAEKESLKRMIDSGSDSEGSLKDFIDDEDTTEDSSSSEDDRKKKRKRNNSSSSPDSDVVCVDDDDKKKKEKNSGSDSEGSDKKEEANKWSSKRRMTRQATGGVCPPIELKCPPSGPKEWWSDIVEDEQMNDMSQSGKLVVLFSILRECELIGDKVLVFSQSLFSLNLIEYFLTRIDEATQDGSQEESLNKHIGSWTSGLDYFRIDGSTQVEYRNTFCKTFNDEDNNRARLFLISTKAGGLGINLTGANRVIIFDASWNPSHDVQSIFRVYRFGQNKPCYIYRFLAQGTMEEKIYDRQVTKLSLSCRVVDEQQIERHFNSSDLNELYAYNPEEKSKRATPILPKDRLLAELLTEHENWIQSYHEHDSLLENKEEEELNEDERKAAWEEYENLKKGMDRVVNTGLPKMNFPFMQQFPQMQQKGALSITALREVLKRENPTASEEQLTHQLRVVVAQINEYLNRRRNMAQQGDGFQQMVDNINFNNTLRQNASILLQNQMQQVQQNVAVPGTSGNYYVKRVVYPNSRGINNMPMARTANPPTTFVRTKMVSVPKVQLGATPMLPVQHPNIPRTHGISEVVTIDDGQDDDDGK